MFALKIFGGTPTRFVVYANNNNNNNNAFVERHNAVAPEALTKQVASYKQC